VHQRCTRSLEEPYSGRLLCAHRLIVMAWRFVRFNNDAREGSGGFWCCLTNVQPRCFMAKSHRMSQVFLRHTNNCFRPLICRPFLLNASPPNLNPNLLLNASPPNLNPNLLLNASPPLQLKSLGWRRSFRRSRAAMFPCMTSIRTTRACVCGVSLRTTARSSCRLNLSSC
jgi:hypothetical protein